MKNRWLGSRGMSNAYAFLYGLIGLALCGFLYAVIDQILLGYLWNHAVDQQLSGTYLQTFKTLLAWVMVLITASFGIGLIVNAHKTKNEF